MNIYVRIQYFFFCAFSMGRLILNVYLNYNLAFGQLKRGGVSLLKTLGKNRLGEVVKEAFSSGVA